MLTNSARLRVTYKHYTFHEQRCQIFAKKTASLKAKNLSTELQENVMQSTPDVTATHGKVLRRFLEGKAGRLVSQIYGIRILAEIAP